MLLAPTLSRYSFTYDNFGANPSATPGTSVIPGATNAEGTYTSIATGANIAQDVCGLYLRVSDGATSTAAKNHLLDVGVDPAGGTSYTTIISDIVCGATGAITTTGGGQQFFFPIAIKAGSQVAVRIQGSNGTAGTVRVGAKFYGQSSRPEIIPCGSFSETIGTITNSNGVSFTPGNAADGTWVSLGTTTNPMWWWQIGYQIDNGTITAEYTYVDIAVGDGSNKHVIHRIMHGGTTGETCGNSIHSNLIMHACYCPVPGGSTIYIRGRCNNAPDTGYNGVAIGIGG
jgi:hypothetical protein